MNLHGFSTLLKALAAGAFLNNSGETPMAKRFGRNQKRAMRQQIADLERQVEKGRKTYATLEATVDYAARVLGSNSVALPPKHLGTCFDSGKIYNVPRMREIGAFEITSQTAVVSRALNSIELQVMRGDAEFDTYRQEIHGYVNVGGKKAYACSKLATLSIPPEFIARELAGLLEPLISQELQKC